MLPFGCSQLYFHSSLTETMPQPSVHPLTANAQPQMQWQDLSCNRYAGLGICSKIHLLPSLLSDLLAPFLGT